MNKKKADPRKPPIEDMQGHSYQHELGDPDRAAQLCLVTAAISLILVWRAYDEVWASIVYLRRVWRQTRSKRAVWDVFWGRALREADEVALAA
jgi:hypothetical protein